MGNEKIIRKLDAYIEDWEENPQYVVMIDGAWGSGKTHFVKQYIENRNKKDRLAWYISAFGVKSTDEFDDRLFEAAHPIVTDKRQKKWLALSYNVLRGAAKHQLGVDLKDYLQPVFDLFENKEDAASGCQVLFVDDIERANISLKELFGYFAQIIDKETRVVFIANKKEIKENDDLKKLEEKLILECYSIEPERENAINRFWEKEMGCEFEELKEKAKDIAEKVDVDNLRNVHRIIYAWKKLIHNLPEAIKGEREYVEDLFEEFFVIYNAYLAGDLKKICEEGKLNDKQIIQKMRETIKAFYQFDFMPELKGANIWPKVIIRGEYDNKKWLEKQFLDAHRLYSDKKKIRENAIKEANNSLNKLKRYVYDNNGRKDIKECFTILLSDFDEGVYARFDEIMTFIKVYMILMKDEVLPIEYNVKKLIDILHEFSRKHQGKIYAIPGIEKISKDSLMKVDDANLQKCIDDLFDIAQESVGFNREDIFTKKQEFLAFIEERERAVTDRTDIKFLEKLNLNDVFKWLGDDVNNHKKLLAFLEFRYRKDFASDKLHEKDYSELDYVKIMIEKYDNICDSLEHSFRLDYRDFVVIRDKYKSLKEYMEGCMGKPAE